MNNPDLNELESENFIAKWNTDEDFYDLLFKDQCKGVFLDLKGINELLKILIKMKAALEDGSDEFPTL